MANNKGMEARWLWSRNAISGGRQVQRGGVEEKGGRGGWRIKERRARGWQVSLPIYIANMLKCLKTRSKQADSDLALMGHPIAFPSLPKASASDWTIMQSFRVETHHGIEGPNLKSGSESTHKGCRGHARF